MNKKRNSGYYNTKDKNTGNRNIGDFNTGHCNTGDWNTGDFNTGSCNTGNWNTGNYNTGYLNTGIPKITIFNKETDLSMQDIVFPEYFYRVNSLQWTYYQDMTSKEKKDNPDAKVYDNARVYGEARVYEDAVVHLQNFLLLEYDIKYDQKLLFYHFLIIYISYS